MVDGACGMHVDVFSEECVGQVPPLHVTMRVSSGLLPHRRGGGRRGRWGRWGE